MGGRQGAVGFVARRQRMYPYVILLASRPQPLDPPSTRNYGWNRALGYYGRAFWGTMVAIGALLICSTGATAVVPGGNQAAAQIDRTAELRKLFTQCDKWISTATAPKAAARRHLRFMQGELRWERWLSTLPANRRAELIAFASDVPTHSWIYGVFSPSRRDRAMVADRLTAISGKSSLILLDTLLLDPSRYVRLHAMNAFWTRCPDRAGTAELFWMAVEAHSGRDYLFDSTARRWMAAPTGKPPVVKVRFHGRRLAVPRVERKKRVFPAADADRATAILQHWHPPGLNRLLLQALRVEVGAQTWDANGIDPLPGGNEVCDEINFIELLRHPTPPWAAGYLLQLINKSRDGDGHDSARWVNPQGRYYFVDASTRPLWMMIIAAGMNPTHFGLVLVPRRHPRRMQICAISETQQHAAIDKMRAWCRSREIKPTAVKLPARSANGIPVQAVSSRHRFGLFELRYGLISWIRWAESLPQRQRQQMLAWGRQSDNIEQAAMAFAPSSSAQMEAARILAGDRGTAPRLILDRLARSMVPAVRLTAINACPTRHPRADAQTILLQLGIARGSAGVPGRDSESKWTLIYHGQRLAISKRLEK